MPDGPVQKTAPEVRAREHPETQPERAEARGGAPRERTPIQKRDSGGVPVVAVQTPTQAPQAAKSPLLQDIENVLEENLISLYKELSPRQKQQFKVEGERTARSIEELLRRAKVAVIEIIRLVRRWLRMIPGINIFFLEQEAKIKAERIIALKNSDSE